MVTSSTEPQSATGERRDGQAPRVGLFGMLGSGNLGNDASMEVVLGHLRSRHPDAVIDAMCMGPGEVRQRYGIDAVPLLWSRRYLAGHDRLVALAARTLGKLIDPIRTLRWVARHDLVIVPGMGVLETSLPVRATGTPYALLLLCAAGQLVGTDVALICVGASSTSQRLVGWMYDASARLATYRSFRDQASRRVLQERGAASARDPVYTDLVFASEHAALPPGDERVVAVGIMTYRGDGGERKEADLIYEHYLGTMISFVVWLLDGGYRVRLLWGDTVDRPTIEAVFTGAQSERPQLVADRLSVHYPCSLADVRSELAVAGTAVAIRFHTALSALQLGTPTLAIGYSAKHGSLMANMGMSEFTVSAKTVRIEELVETFTILRARASGLRETLLARNTEQRSTLERQFEDLSTLLADARERHARSVGGRRRRRIGARASKAPICTP